MSKSHSDTKRFPLAARLGTSASLLTLIAMGAISPVHAQDEEEGEAIFEEEIVVRGMRSSIQSAQELKKASNKIQDSIVAEDIGKLPDRSIAEALQRVPGVSVSRFDEPGDPEHFAGEGAGVAVRGLTQVRAELNGRDIFSASDGRALSFDDVPAELMAGVDVFKTPTADMIAGGLGGIVNLRTRMPFDSDGQVISATIKGNYGDQISETNLEGSALYSNVWDTNIGKLGLLFDLSSSTISSRADNLYNRAYRPRTDLTQLTDDPDTVEVETETLWVPRGSDWRRNDYTRDRNGKYLAIQLEPTDELQFYLTAFESRAKRDWYENAFFLDAGNAVEPQQIGGLYDWVLDENNVLLSGTVTADPGVALGTSSRLSSNSSKTRDYSFGVEWSDGGLTITADYQRVLSDAQREDYTLGTVLFPSQLYWGDLNSDSGPTIIDTTGALENLSNYSYGQMMSLPVDNEATSDAARLDVKYDFEDSVVRSVKAGVRWAEKEALNREGNHWSARVQPWNLCCLTDDASIPTIDNQALMQEYSFDDFQRGDARVPTDAWMYTADAVANFRDTVQVMAAATTPPDWASWAVTAPDYSVGGPLDLNAPQNQNTQSEKSTEAYVMADFEFTESFGGNVGVRYVSTENSAEGYLVYEDRALFDGVQPWLYGPPQALEATNDYSFVLPSLNLRYDATEDLVFRFSAAQGIWKPEFWRLKNYLEFQVNDPEAGFDFAAVGITDQNGDSQINAADVDSTNYTQIPWRYNLDSGEANPFLEPMIANQYDLTAEWYFNDAGGMVYAGAFVKQVEDFFRINSFSFPDHNITWTGAAVVNVGTADVNGIEIGGTYYFDDLGLEGFGISANLTVLDNSTEIPVYDEEGSTVLPLDTDNRVIDVPELEGLSDQTANITLMYENETFYARLAYNWTSESLQSIGPNGWNFGENRDEYNSAPGVGYTWRLPIYADAYGQLDFSAGYNFNDNVSLNFEAYNISQSNTRGIMRQNPDGAGDHTAFVYSQDTRYGLSLRLTY